jgi:hypothetical protein
VNDKNPPFAHYTHSVLELNATKKLLNTRKLLYLIFSPATKEKQKWTKGICLFWRTPESHGPFEMN